MFYSKKSKSFRNLKNLIPGLLLGICCSAYASNGNNLIPSLLDEGIKNYTNKKYEAAADYLGQVVDMDPDHSQARYYLTYSLALSGNNELALKHAKILARKFPKDKQYKDLVNQIKAEVDRQLTIKKTKQSGSSSGNIQKEVMIGGYKSAEKSESEMREPKVDYTPRDIKPARPLTELEKAIVKIDEEEYDTAESMLKDLLKKEPNNSEIYHNLGVIEMGRNNFKGAASYFDKATGKNPKDFQSFFLKAECFRTIGEYAKAESALKSATDIRYDEFALMNLAGINIDMGRYKNAEDIYNKILAKNPQFSEATVGLAQIRILQGKTDEAMEMVNSALSKGNNGDANYVKGLLLIANGMYGEACEQFDAALQTSPGNQKYLVAKAQALIKSLELSKGLDVATSVLNANPDSVPAMLVIAEAFILTSGDQEAEDQLNKIKTYGNFADYYRLSGMLAKSREDEAEARAMYKKYFEMTGSMPANAYEYAEFLENLSDGKKEAQSIYEEIVKLFPDTIYERKAKDRILQLTNQNASDSESNDNSNNDDSSNENSDSGVSSDSNNDDDSFNWDTRPGNTKF